MITFEVKGCALGANVVNGINVFTTIPLNPQDEALQQQALHGTVDLHNSWTCNYILISRVNHFGTISFDIQKGYTITLVNGAYKVELTEGVYTSEQINEIFQDLPFQPFKKLLLSLDEINLSSNAVNFKKLDEILKNKDKIFELIHEGKIEASDEQLKNLTNLESYIYANMHKLCLLWKNAQLSEDWNLTMLPKEILSIIFSYIPLTGKESIQIIKPIEENISIDVDTNTLTTDHSSSIIGDLGHIADI